MVYVLMIWLDLKRLYDVEVKEKYQAEISKTFADLDCLREICDININTNINISISVEN
jgi:hypothetical protein